MPFLFFTTSIILIFTTQRSHREKENLNINAYSYVHVFHDGSYFHFVVDVHMSIFAYFNCLYVHIFSTFIAGASQSLMHVAYVHGVVPCGMTSER